MRYDIYRGTEEDLRNSAGSLVHISYTKAQVEAFCRRQHIKVRDFLDGDYVSVGITGFWLEEAM